MPDENSTSVVASVCINYILFGNHDFFVFRKTEALEDIFLSREDISTHAMKIKNH